MIKTKVTKSKTTVESDKFEMVKMLMGSGSHYNKVARGGRYYAFQGDNPINEFDDKQEGVRFSSKLALASICMGIKLWREGIAECNLWIEKNARDPKMHYVVNCPGIDYVEYDGPITDQMMGIAPEA
jgi:hypothetical protein